MRFDVGSRREELKPICERHGVLKLWLFGSGVDGGFDPSVSDLDFAVEFRKMKPVERKRSYFGLVRELETLFGREVDVIEPEAIINPYLIGSIEESQRVVYAA